MREERDNAKKLLAQIEWSQIPSLKAENAALREQLTAAQKDAERYRWLKKQPYFAVPLNSTYDAAIDAAMEAKS